MVYLIQAVISGNKITYAEAGDKVKLICEMDHVAIVDNSKGERFSTLIGNLKKD